ncbi:MAG: FMN-binding protein [Jatrophihabitantaceae bacterium]
MKRVLLAITGTVLGLFALLSFKSHGTAIGGPNTLPSAALPGAGTSTSSARRHASTSAPPTVTQRDDDHGDHGDDGDDGDDGNNDDGPPPTQTQPAPSDSSTHTQTTGPAATTQTVTGSAIQTKYGVVQVTVTVQGSMITRVRFAQLTGDDDRSVQINSQAAPILLQQTLSVQSAQIDGVSGASYTSQGYEQSLQSALDKAGVH